MTTSTTFIETIARFFGTNVDPETSLEKAVSTAHRRTAQRYATEESALFDQDFLRTKGAPILVAFLDGKLARHDAAVALSRAWNVDLGPISARDRKWRVADTAMIADTFLTELTLILDA